MHRWTCLVYDTLPHRLLNTNCVLGNNAIWTARRVPSQSKEVVKDGGYFQILWRTRSYSLHVGGKEYRWEDVACMHNHVSESEGMNGGRGKGQMFLLPCFTKRIDISAHGHVPKYLLHQHSWTWQKPLCMCCMGPVRNSIWLDTLHAQWVMHSDHKKYMGT